MLFKFLLMTLACAIIALPPQAHALAIPSYSKVINKKQNLVCDTRDGQLGYLKRLSRVKQSFVRLNSAREIRKLDGQIRKLKAQLKMRGLSLRKRRDLLKDLKLRKTRRAAIISAEKRCLKFAPVAITPSPTIAPSFTPTTIPSATPTPALFNHPDTVLPKVKHAEDLGEFPVVLDSSWQILSGENAEDQFTAQYLADAIAEASNNAVTITPAITGSEASSKTIVVGNPADPGALAALASAYGINLDSMIAGEDFDQGYVLAIRPQHILLLARSAAGRFYAAVTLSWLLKAEGNLIYLPDVLIRDWPDTRYRSFYGGGVFDVAELGRQVNTTTEREIWLKYLARRKFNMWLGGNPNISASYNPDTGVFTQPNPASSNVRTAIAFRDKFKQHHFANVITLNPRSVRSLNKNLMEGVFVEKSPFQWRGDQALSSLPNIAFNNGEFAEQNEGVPLNWRFSNQGDASDRWVHEPDGSYDGGAAMHLVSHVDRCGTTTSGAHLFSDTYSLAANQVYRLSLKADVRGTRGCDSNAPQVTVVMLDENGQSTLTRSVALGYPAEGYAGWQDYNITFSTYNGERSFYVYSRAQGTDSVDVSLDKFQLESVSDKLRNVIDTPSSRLKVYPSLNSSTPYVKDLDYSVEDTGTWDLTDPMSGKRTIVRRLPLGHIPPTGTVYLSYDFVINFQQYRDEDNSLAEPLVYNYFNQLFLTSSMPYLEPDFVFIGEDEHRGMNRDSRSKSLGLSNGQLLARHLNIINSMVQSYRPEAKVLVWDDMFNPSHTGGSETAQLQYGGILGASWSALPYLNHNMIPIAWRYSASDSTNKMANSPLVYERFGLNMWAGPGAYGSGPDSDNLPSMKQWSSQVKRYGLEGIVSHEFYDKIDGLDNSAEYSWNNFSPSPIPASDKLEICNGLDDDGDNLYWERSYRQAVWPFSSSGIDEGFSLQTDVLNCGACGNICHFSNAEAQCVAGACEFRNCLPYYEERDGNLANGCE